MCGGYSGILTGKTGKTHQSVEDIAIFRAMPGVVDHRPGRRRRAALGDAGDDGERRADVPAPDPRPEPGRSSRTTTGSRSARATSCATAATSASSAPASRRSASWRRPTCWRRRASPPPCSTCRRSSRSTRTPIVALAERTGAIVTAEDHSIIGGLGSAVAEVLGEHRPTRMRRVGWQDTYGESGPNDALLEKYGLTAGTSPMRPGQW